MEGQNKIIKSIGQGIAKAPGLEFNLVFIYGSNNEIMTHYIQAIGNYMLYNESSSRIRYTELSKFFEEFHEAVEQDKLELFEEFYTDIEILFLDSFHTFPKAKRDKEEFMKIFDKLIESNKQLVVTSNKPIDEITGLDKKTAKKIGSLTGLIIKFK
jgi:chromosomal replication initiator protein